MTLLALTNLVAVAYYLVVTGWSVIEVVRCALGMAALWGPYGVLLYRLLATEVPDRTVRFALCAVASYTLTTVAYFACAVLGIQAAFYALHIAIVGAIVVRLVRLPALRRAANPLGWWRQLDWVLSTLVVASLILNVPYKTPLRFSPDAVTFALYDDHLYHVGQVYELARNVPPRQQAMRAGTPERAYHMFSHLTTMLLGRFTGQGDLLRVHLLYHYSVIEIGLCLLMFSLGTTLTSSRIAGYIAAAILYVVAASWPPLGPSPHPHFYFTLFPHISSGVDPVRVTSPQMYSGLLVMFGVLLGVLLASIRKSAGPGARVLLVVVALMVAATSRFRVHVFLPLLPGFLLVLAGGWWRARDSAYLLAAGVALTGSALLCLEMRSPVYLPDTAGLSIAYNGLGVISWINTWPFAQAVWEWLYLHVQDPAVLKWPWQCVSLAAFVLLNMIGLPLLAATVAYLCGARAFREHAWFTVLILWLVVVSTVAGMLITTSYDPYSVGGQLLLHTRWYVFPFAATTIWSLYAGVQRRLSCPPAVWVAIALGAAALAVVAQLRTPMGGVLWAREAKPLKLDPDEWLALKELREHADLAAVVLSDRYANQNKFVFSGLTGRAAYMEGGINVVSSQALRVNPADDRQRRIHALWSVTDPTQFCSLLAPTGATHLVEYVDQPLRVQNAPCLARLWVSPRQRVTIWGVRTDQNAGLSG